MVHLVKPMLFVAATVIGVVAPIVVQRIAHGPPEGIGAKLAQEELAIREDIQAQRRQIDDLLKEAEEFDRLTAKGPEAPAIVEKAVAEVVVERAAAREDAKRHAVMASDALQRSEAMRSPPSSGAPIAAQTAFVYFGSCGVDGWLSVNFDNAPPCRSGDIVVLPKYVQGRAVRALRNLTPRTELPSDKGSLGPALDGYIAAGSAAKIVDVYPMSKISGPPILYWAKIELP